MTHLLWDWDNTLVNDYNVRESSGQPLRVKPEAKELLEALPHRHVITSSGERGRIEREIKEAGLEQKLQPHHEPDLNLKSQIYLDRIFDGVFDREYVTKTLFDGSQIKLNFGKGYGRVLQEVGHSLHYAHAAALVIGDALGDAPVDVKDLVFLWVEQGYTAPIQVIGSAIGSLNHKDGLYAGFQTLYASAPLTSEGRVQLYSSTNVKEFTFAGSTGYLGYIDPAKASSGRKCFVYGSTLENREQVTQIPTILIPKAR